MRYGLRPTAGQLNRRQIRTMLRSRGILKGLLRKGGVARG